ncbi:hypothetical protein [Saccharopolyspora sp. NPDC049357]
MFLRPHTPQGSSTAEDVHLRETSPPASAVITPNTRPFTGPAPN